MKEIILELLEEQLQLLNHSRDFAKIKCMSISTNDIIEKKPHAIRAYNEFSCQVVTCDEKILKLENSVAWLKNLKIITNDGTDKRTDQADA